jgi:hypothetical protein
MQQHLFGVLSHDSLTPWIGLMLDATGMMADERRCGRGIAIEGNVRRIVRDSNEVEMEAMTRIACTTNREVTSKHMHAPSSSPLLLSSNSNSNIIHPSSLLPPIATRRRGHHLKPPTGQLHTHCNSRCQNISCAQPFSHLSSN